MIGIFRFGWQRQFQSWCVASIELIGRHRYGHAGVDGPADSYRTRRRTRIEEVDARRKRVLSMANPARITFPADSGGGDVVERTKRHESVAYPELALREAITNALVHRDYTVVGSEVEVKIFPDRLVIQNPGSLMPGITTEDLRRDPHPSRRRNPLIAEIASLDYWIERAGTGTTRMIKLCEDSELPAPEFEDRSSGFTVTFRRNALAPPALSTLGLTPNQIEAVEYVRAHGSITNREYRELVDVGARTASKDLTEIADEFGVLRQVGAGRSVRYVLPDRA